MLNLTHAILGYAYFPQTQKEQKLRIESNSIILTNAHLSGNHAKGRLSYHLCIECFSQLSFDSEVYTKSAVVVDFVYTSESNESCEKHSTKR